MPDGPPDPTATLTTMSTGVVVLGCVRGGRNLTCNSVGELSQYTGILQNFVKLTIFTKNIWKIDPRVADTSPFFLEQFVVFPERPQEAEMNRLIPLA